MSTLLESLQPAAGTDGTAVVNRSTATVDDTGSRSRRLPRIDLPKFGGNYCKWSTFSDLFTSLVRSSTEVSYVEKLQYLKLSLTGTAAECIKNVAVTSENFQRAWDSLVAYYESKRVLVRTYLDALFAARQVSRKSAAEIKQLLSTITQAIGALQALNRPTNHWDDIVVHTTIRKLDPNSVKEWEQKVGASTTPSTWSDLETFLVKRIRSLQAFERATGASQTIPQAAAKAKANCKNDSSGARAHHAAVQSTDQCPCCGGTHYVGFCHSFCPIYKGKTVEQRLEFITQKYLCYNCLSPHPIKLCRSKKRCNVCKGHHHTTVHKNRTSLATTWPPQTSGSGQPAQATAPSTAVAASNSTTGVPNTNNAVSSNVACAEQMPRVSVLLATAIVKVVSHSGEQIEARVLLDQGSEISLVSESLAQRLRLPRSRSSIPIVGIGATGSRQTNGVLKVTLVSRVKLEFRCEVNASILPKLTGYLPAADVSKHYWPHWQGLELADPDFTHSRKIDFVLGADVYGHLLEPGIRKRPANTPIAQDTKLGWILSGPISGQPSVVAYSFQCSPDRELIELLQRFSLQEEEFISLPDQLLPDEAQCDEHYAATHSRDYKGSYTVRLPLKNLKTTFSDSRPPARNALSRMEKRFSEDPALRDSYINFLKEYKELGHMCIAPDAPTEANRVFYLPHFGVIRETSTTTKLRVVFNGSQRPRDGLSLNECLYAGPKIQTDLADVILRWRQYEYVSVDIEKMYRQIRVHPDDWDLQRILWRSAPYMPVTAYHLCTVTYGLASAPYLAIKTLRQLVADERHRFPQAVDVIRLETYVDDVFSQDGTTRS